MCVVLYVSGRPSPTEANVGGVKVAQRPFRFRSCLPDKERRKAERDAAKRAPGQAGAGESAAARANVNMNPVGDWTTQTEDLGVLFRTLGTEIVELRASAGDREAQFSQGYWLVREADVAAGATRLGAAGRSPQVDVGFVLCPAQLPGLTPDCDASMRHLMPQPFFCGYYRPWAEEGMALLEKAAGQGHAYAMHELAGVHHVRNEHEQAMKWYTKGAEAGLSRAMFELGTLLEEGKGEAAPDFPAAADWYRRAADAGAGEAANNLSHMYSLGRGGACQMMPATSLCHILILRFFN